MFKNATVLITGGTGSFGKQMVAHLLRTDVKKIIIFSRDELKQFELEKSYASNAAAAEKIRFFIGDIRDRDRLYRAFDGVDYVIHAAALKQVPACEYNPFEAVKTNIIGAQNIAEAAIDKGVKKVIALSTDKAANPVNLYGATKLCSDKIFVAANSYVGERNTSFAVVRYGNVLGSRGSVVPLFRSLAGTGRALPITDERMTRFWITLEQGVQFVLDSLERMIGGEIFIPKIPSMRILDLAQAIAPENPVQSTGIRPGEKLHEVMITEDDARHAFEFDDYYVIEPELQFWNRDRLQQGEVLPEGFRYSSETNTRWLSVAEIKEMIAALD